MGDLRENPRTSGIVRHDSHIEPGGGPAGNRTRFAYARVRSLTATTLRPIQAIKYAHALPRRPIAPVYLGQELADAETSLHATPTYTEAERPLPGKLKSKNGRRGTKIAVIVRQQYIIVTRMVFLSITNQPTKFLLRRVRQLLSPKRVSMPWGILLYYWLFSKGSDIRRNLNMGSQKAQKISGLCLLVLDAHSSHKFIQDLEFCEQNSITIIYLPSFTTHRLQPLDRRVHSGIQPRTLAKWRNWPATSLNGVRQLAPDNLRASQQLSE
ncbi:hypothetical protein PR048_007947 [Dryococelus australis]|uniref:DDE-1 domain-containing protein n=1 Tax=Dryococelus australis TaxID=614101 RepID=A0ABQ9HW20_9NEOP|nr:hypothetical protein PR048_007947 [Dryococelus australis]